MKLLVSKDRSKLPRAGSALKVSTRANSKTSPLGKPEEPGALAWCGVSGRAPAGTTWARSEAESGRAVAAVPPELAVGPGSHFRPLLWPATEPSFLLSMTSAAFVMR